MRRCHFAAIILFSVVVFDKPATQAEVKNEELHLRATFVAVAPLASFSGKVIPADFDPSFAITLRIETIEPLADDLLPGTTATFAIHSPSLLFQGEPDRGVSYDFYVTREIENGKIRSLGLATHQACADDDIVGFPLTGWVGYTNTGDSISDMTITAQTDPNKPPVASSKTDATGRFSFPTLGPGVFYLRGTKKLVDATVNTDAVVTVKKGKKLIACLVAEAEETKGNSPQ